LFAYCTGEPKEKYIKREVIVAGRIGDGRYKIEVRNHVICEKDMKTCEYYVLASDVFPPASLPEKLKTKRGRVKK